MKSVKYKSIKFYCILAIEVLSVILIVFVLVFVIDSGFNVEELSNCGGELIFLLINEGLLPDVAEGTAQLCFAENNDQLKSALYAVYIRA